MKTLAVNFVLGCVAAVIVAPLVAGVAANLLFRAGRRVVKGRPA